ncbi:MAG: hypothetical protein K0V04_41690 [Deltaproteobacteria bacterium]|nr:hypothetical protein [Deltaproteobacteria bacterium]
MESAELTARRTRLEVDHHRTRRQEARGTLEGRSQTLRTRDAAVEQARRQLDALDADD